NDIFRQLLTDTLSTQFPHMVIEEAADGREALPKVEALLPDLVFMDIKLPDENGLELTQKVKTKYPETIVVMLTNYDLPEYREAAHRIGANYFIVKGSTTNEEIVTLTDSILLDLGFSLDGSKGGNLSKRNLGRENGHGKKD
ncbi:MAG: response regulator transcription factor, partial [Deltaproteobacteria bacterium]|nr:response regulator transcription factor [Deltaproteobacteria bacterium]